MRPDDRLPTKRTESIGSRVPPAVTSSLSPSSERGAYAPPPSTRSMAARISGGSASLPVPHSPREASSPVAGGTTTTPRASSSSTLATVAGCAHIRSFIAGAITSGTAVARAALVRRLSARPVASLAIVFADAGAIA